MVFEVNQHEAGIELGNGKATAPTRMAPRLSTVSGAGASSCNPLLQTIVRRPFNGYRNASPTLSAHRDK